MVYDSILECASRERYRGSHESSLASTSAIQIEYSGVMEVRWGESGDSSSFCDIGLLYSSKSMRKET